VSLAEKASFIRNARGVTATSVFRVDLRDENLIAENAVIADGDWLLVLMRYEEISATGHAITCCPSSDLLDAVLHGNPGRESTRFFVGARNG
jgi:hypothetical protein